MLWICCLPTDATQRQSACFIYNFSISWRSPAYAIYRQTMAAYGWRRAGTHKDVQWGYLTVCQRLLGQKKKPSVEGKKWSARRYVSLSGLIFTYFLLPTKGVKLMRLFHGPITSNLVSSSTLYILISYAIKCAPCHVFMWKDNASGRLKAGTSFLYKPRFCRQNGLKPCTPTLAMCHKSQVQRFKKTKHEG